MYDFEDEPCPSDEFERRAHVNDKINKLRERMDNVEELLITTRQIVDVLKAKVDLLEQGFIETGKAIRLLTDNAVSLRKVIQGILGVD